MRCEIFIVSHAADLPYLRWALEPIRRFGTGFSGVTVVYPAAEQEAFAPLCDEAWLNMRAFDQFPGKGMLDHMAQKLMADLHCPDADFIFHTDSDCIFREPFCPEDYFHDGKPVLLIEPYDLLKSKHPGRHRWQAVTEEALGFKPEFETMCRHPMVNPRSVYKQHRDYLEAKWKMPLRHFYLMGRDEYPQTRCEFNSLGAYALRASETSGPFHHLIDVSKEARPKDKLIQFWSHSPPGKPQSTWIDNQEVIVIPEVLINQILEL